jgi:hypothetical protein
MIKIVIDSKGISIARSLKDEIMKTLTEGKILKK